MTAPKSTALHALYLAAKHLQPVVNVFTVTGSDSKNFIIGISFHCKIFSRFREIPSLAPTLVTVSALLSLLGRLPSTPWTVWTLDTGSATFGRSGPRSPIILLLAEILIMGTSTLLIVLR